jgi:Tol biopolymer transport system component
MKRNLILLLIALVLIAGGLAYWQLSPEVQEISPQPQDGPLYGLQFLQIEFSRAMDPDSVEDHLILDPDLSGSLTWNPDQTVFTFTPESSWPSGETISLNLQPGSQSRLGLPVVQAHRWEYTISPPLLIYLWPAEDPSNLYLLHPETGESRALTALEEGVLDFDVSPDGSRVYYAVQHSSEESVIYVYNRNRGESTSIMKCYQALCRTPRISPDGRYLAYEWAPQIAGAVTHVRIYDIQEGGSVLVGDPTHFTADPLWSSTGWIAYYDHTEKAYLFTEPQGSEVLRLENDTGGAGSWAPDGKTFFTTEIYRPEENLAPRHILRFNLNADQILNLTRDNYLEDANPMASPDGDWIAFERKSLRAERWTPGRQLWLMLPDGQQPQPLTDAPNYHHTNIAWHPDGKRLAYVRYNNAELSEPPEIWLIDRAGEENIRLIINGYAPRWLP